MSVSALPASDFELLFSLLPAPHGVLAPNGTLLALNDALARLLPAGAAAALPGQPVAALCAAALAHGVTLADADAWTTGLAAALGGTPQVLAPPLPGPADAPAPGGYWQATLQPVPAQQPRYVLVGLLDVSAEWRSTAAAAEATAQAQQEQAQVHFLTENLPQLIWSANATGEVTYTNQHFRDYTGHDVLRMSLEARLALWQQIIHPDDLPGMHARWAGALEVQQAFEVEFRMRGNGGDYHWFLSHVVAQRGADGEVQRWFGLCTDVDAHHRAQERVDTQQRLMQRILDQLPLTISTMAGPDLVFTFLSAQARQSMGARAQVGRTVAESLPELADQGYPDLLHQVLTTGQPVLGHEERSTLLDPATGELCEHYYNFGYLPLAGDEAAPGVLAYSLDVTEQVLARQRNEALLAEARAADHRLRHVTENLPSVTFIADQQGQVLYLSPQWYRYTGTSPADDLAQTWRSCLHPEDHDRVAHAYATALTQGLPWRYELRLRRHDGQYRWFMSQGVPEALAEAQAAGRSRQWFGADVDVHDLHEARQHLEAKDQQLSQILSQTPALIATMEGPDHRFAFTNPGFEALVGRRARLGHPVAEHIAEAANQGFVALLDGVYRTGESYVGEEVPLTLDDPATGAARQSFLNFTCQALRNGQGTVTGVLAFAVDVTAQVLARQEATALQTKVQAADARLRHLAATLPIVTFITDAAGRTTYISPQWYAYTGQAPGGPWAEVDALWPTMLHPDDRHRATHLIQQGIAAARPERVELRLRRHDGQYRWFMTEAVPELDATGQLVRRHGYLLDVHDQREQTQALARSRQDFAALADNIAQLAWMAEANGRIFWYNQQWYDFTGLSPATMEGTGWSQVHDPALAADVNARYLTAVQAGQPWEDTFPLRRHDGEYRWFLSRARPIRDAATGTVVRWFGTNTDVTELRQLQHQLGTSEEELRIQAESIPQQVWTAQPDGTVDFYNHRTAAYLGEAMDKNGAAHWLSFVHPDDHVNMQERWLHAIETQRYYEAEFRLRRYDGQYRWFLGQAQARRTPGGQIIKWYGTNTDVHQQRQLQEQVLASQARFQQLLETLPQLAWTARPDGGISYYNQRWYEYTGATLADLQNWGWEQFVHPDDLAATAQRWQHSLATGEPYEAEQRWRDHRGQYRWFLGRAEALRDKKGAITLWVGANTDVHEFKQVQQQLEAQNARLVRTNDDLDNFVYTASHDLKQPITNMAGIFEELTRSAFFRDPDAVKLIHYFEQALARIFNTIDDLSAIVQVQRQQQELLPDAVAIAPLVAEVIGSLQDQIALTQAKFELDLATCPVVDFVRPNLQSVLFNLFSNSLKYAAPGRPPRIRLSSTLDTLTGRAVLTVQDNGLGIDLERFGPQLYQLFRRFHAHVDGTGVGLYLVNRIVQNHGGRMEVSSVVDEGTTFRIYL